MYSLTPPFYAASGGEYNPKGFKAFPYLDNSGLSLNCQVVSSMGLQVKIPYPSTPSLLFLPACRLFEASICSRQLEHSQGLPRVDDLELSCFSLQGKDLKDNKGS